MFSNTKNKTTDYYPLIICCGLLVAVLLRVAALFSFKESLYFHTLLMDERFYHNWALQILHGTRESHTVYVTTPIPAYFMALIYKLFSPQILWVRFANIILGTLTCLFICFIGGQIGGKKVGVIALFVSAVYAPFILNSIVPLKTTLSLFFFSLFMWLYLRLVNCSSKALEHLLTGLVAGFLINIRPNSIGLIPAAIALYIFLDFRNKILLKKIALNTTFFATGMLAVILSCVIRNYIVAGKPVYLPSQGGFNFFLGNNLESKLPYFEPARFAFPSPLKQSIQFNIEASRRVGKKLSPEESSTFWTNEVLHMASQYPAKFAWKLLQKTLAVLNQEKGDRFILYLRARHEFTYCKLARSVVWFT